MLQVARCIPYTSIMSHLNSIYGPTNQEVAYPYHIPPTP